LVFRFGCKWKYQLLKSKTWTFFKFFNAVINEFEYLSTTTVNNKLIKNTEKRISESFCFEENIYLQYLN
jgi:hypothetical protein